VDSGGHVRQQRLSAVAQSVTARSEGAESRSDDADLILAARENTAAFGLVYERYLKRVYTYFRARTATEEDAADLTQQVFLRALAALPQYRGQKESFAAWLFRIAHNTAIDAHRRRRPTITWQAVPEGLHPRTGDDLDVRLIHQEAMVRLHALLGTLKADTREILALHYAARLTVAEVAAVVGKSEAAIKKQLSRTIHILREHYHDDP
jgi:RNA polymerase sigma-70 factor (ECF subfamily)